MKRIKAELEKRDEMIAAKKKERRKAGRIPDDATHHLIFVIDTSTSMGTPDVQRANGVSCLLFVSVIFCSFLFFSFPLCCNRTMINNYVVCAN